MSSFGTDFISDGMNEKGLSIGLLWFPGAKYPSLEANELQKTIALEDLALWILGSFATLDEVKEGIKKVQIWAHVIPQLKQIPPVHYSIHDSSGNSIVIEFLDGKMEILDNPIGVLTNVPKFEWHKTNLRNYINLSAIGRKKIVFDGTVLDPTSQGSGLLGLPGDWTSPSRFVRISVIKDFVKKTKTPKQNVNLAFHILNDVDIPYGVVRPSSGNAYDYTQWAIVKDLSSMKLYFRTYKDLNIRTVDLKDEFNKAVSNRIKIPMT